MKIRVVAPEDNKSLAKVLREVLIEMDVPKIGTAYADKELDQMFESYSGDSSIYYVIESNGSLLGGAGIAPLKNGDQDVCELQKMYFAPEARGGGNGYKMIQKCLEFARQKGFNACYIETMPNMLAAQKLYKKMGFHYIDKPMGNTGHCSCPIWMLKTL